MPYIACFSPVCSAYAPPGLSDQVIQFLLLPDNALIILQWGFAVLAIAFTSKRAMEYWDARKRGRYDNKILRDLLVSVLTFGTFVLFYYGILALETVIGWKRPFDPTTACPFDASVCFYYDVVNVNGAPDPLFITTPAFLIGWIYFWYAVLQRIYPVLFTIAIASVVIASFITNLVFQRIYWQQSLVNLACAIVLSAVLPFILRTFLFIVGYQEPGTAAANRPPRVVKTQPSLNGTISRPVNSSFTPQQHYMHQRLIYPNH